MDARDEREFSTVPGAPGAKSATRRARAMRNVGAIIAVATTRTARFNPGMLLGRSRKPTPLAAMEVQASSSDASPRLPSRGMERVFGSAALAMMCVARPHHGFGYDDLENQKNSSPCGFRAGALPVR